MAINEAEVIWDTPTAQEVQWDTPTPAPTQRKRSFTQEVMHQLKRTGRMAATGITGTGTMLLDASDAVAKIAGLVPHSAQSPGARFQQALSELGLPEDETPAEKITGFAGTVMAGALDPASKATQLLAARNIPKGLVTEQDQVKQMAQELRKQGVKIAPKASGGTIPRALEQLGGPGRINQALQADNAEVLTKLAKDANKIPYTSNLTLDVLKSQANRLAEEGYRPIEDIARIPVGRLYRQDLRKVITDLADNRSFPLAQRDNIRQEVLKYLTPDGQRPILEYSGKDAIKAIQTLRRESDDLFRSVDGDKQLAKAKKLIADALENQIERSVGGDMLKNFRQARVDLAKNYATRRILADPDSGLVDATKAAGLDEKLTGQLATIAKAGSPAFRQSTKVPTAGNPEGMNQWELMATAGGLGGFASGNPLFGIGAAVPAASMLARKGVQSKIGQQLMAANPLFDEAAHARMLLGSAQQFPYSLFGMGE